MGHQIYQHYTRTVQYRSHRTETKSQTCSSTRDLAEGTGLDPNPDVAAAEAAAEAAAAAAAARRIAYAVSKNLLLVSARDARLSAKAIRTRSEESDGRRWGLQLKRVGCTAGGMGGGGGGEGCKVLAIGIHEPLDHRPRVPKGRVRGV